MANTLIIPDIHGNGFWKNHVNDNKGSQIVFLGDYFDSRYEEYGSKDIETFLEIIEYKKNNPSTILLIGNHDFHYIIKNELERYSGYQPQKAEEIHKLLIENSLLMQMAFCTEDTLITHAGVSKTWCYNNSIDYKEPIEKITDSVNQLWKFSKMAFAFKGQDPYGDSTVSNPIWIRPDSLISDSINFNQIVGHTIQKEPVEREGFNGKKIWFIDCDGIYAHRLITKID